MADIEPEISPSGFLDGVIKIPLTGHADMSPD
jgi:hypothetical protein